ncbi:hypothetical protein [Brevibacterium moorei]|uniref:hypothetical protein n=1 Tax=Brevibacterium moorei TaxID=2968457 RepID=UPI00211C632F|nr:hypothetical protein [Brevibacterium sp. 68QC2CO]MCQ9385140.1 hypothetical protein [Brevibacterium sp. 68QC2CO]
MSAATEALTVRGYELVADEQHPDGRWMRRLSRRHAAVLTRACDIEPGQFFDVDELIEQLEANAPESLCVSDRVRDYAIDFNEQAGEVEADYIELLMTEETIRGDMTLVEVGVITKVR